MPPNNTQSLIRCGLLLAFALLLAYANALSDASFQFDDFNVIVDNPQVHSWPAWWHELGHGIRPLLKFTYTLDWQSAQSGLEIRQFHLTNLLIHGLNCFLVLLLAHRFALAHASLHNTALRIAASTAGLFALHPIATEAVTYVCGRSSSLMTSFYLLGLLVWTLASSPAQHRRYTTLLRHVIAPLCFLCALMVKETAITFPFALLIWDACSGTARGPWREHVRRTWVNWLLLGVIALYFILNPAYSTHIHSSLDFNSLIGNLANVAVGISWLLRQWALPLWLNIDPDLPVLHSFTLPAMAALLGLSGLVVLLWRAYPHRPWLSFALAWLFLQLLPLHLVLPRLDIANERQMYLAAWPLALALMIELHLGLALRPRLRDGMVGLLLLGCLALTITRNQDYRNEITLWQATARLSPEKARVYNNLGYAYAQAGRIEEARRAYQHALVLNPLEPKVRNNLSLLPPLFPLQ